MLSSATAKPVDIYGFHARATANRIEAFTLGKVVFPGPRLVPTALGRARLDLGRNGKGRAA
jgi:hypothetical protein